MPGSFSDISFVTLWILQRTRAEVDLDMWVEEEEEVFAAVEGEVEEREGVEVAPHDTGIIASSINSMQFPKFEMMINA